jgi:proteasome component ECM29
MVRNRTALALPMDALVAQFADDSVPSLVKNLTKIYLELGFPRLSPSDQVALAPRLLQVLRETTPPAQRQAVYLLVLPVLGQLPVKGATDRTTILGLTSPAAADALLAFLLDVLLLENSAQQPVHPAPGETLLPLPPPGLSRDALLALTDTAGKVVGLDTRDKVVAAKLGIVQLLARSGDALTAGEVALPLLVASACGDHLVASTADAAFKRRVSRDDLEALPLVRGLFALLLGTPAEVTGVAPTARRRPADEAVFRAGLVVLTRSTAAAAAFPANVQVLGACLGGRDTTPRRRVLGLMFAHHLAERAPAAALRVVGPVTLVLLLRFLDDGALGKLGRRQPALVHDRVDLLTRCFTAACSPDARLRGHVLEALALLRDAFADPAPAVAPQILALLQQTVQRPEPHARLLAVQYARGLFPMANMAAMFTCLVAAADPSADVRSEAARALTRPEFRAHENEATGDESGGGNSSSMDTSEDSGSAPVDAVGKKEEGSTLDLSPPLVPQMQFPPFPEAVTYLAARISSIKVSTLQVTKVLSFV